MLQTTINKANTKIELDNFENGIYILQLKQDNIILKTEKLIIQ